MKQVLLISDTHRDDDTFAEIVRCYPDAKLMIHAGDSCYQKDDEHLKNMLVVKEITILPIFRSISSLPLSLFVMDILFMFMPALTK